MANHPLIKDVEKWILDSFSFMDGIGYDVVFDDEEIKNTNIIVADIDGLTDSDFEKGKKNLLKSIPNKIKAEFSYLRIRSSKDGDYFIMYVVLADNDDYFKTKNIPYINLNESKKSARKSIKESNLPNKVYDVLNELASNFLLDYDEFVEFERNGLEHHFDKIRELSAKLKKADIKGDDDLYQKIADEIVTVVKRANGTLDESIKESADDNWYKLKMLNEMLDAMEEDEYNVPKLGIYGVTKNIDLDEGAIEALIKYYK